MTDDQKKARLRLERMTDDQKKARLRDLMSDPETTALDRKAASSVLMELGGGFAAHDFERARVHALLDSRGT